MKVKNVDLKFYVLYHDASTNKLTNLNILYGMQENIKKEVKSKRVYNKNTLKNYLNKEFKYHYWSKSECELIIYDLLETSGEKVDIYTQIYPNLDLIVDYINAKMQLNFT